MNNTINITLAGHSSSGLNHLEDVMQDELDFELHRKLLVNGHVDPYEDISSTTNVLVLELGERWREVLAAIAARSSKSRAAVILIGPDGNAEMVRLALKAGAKDFHTNPVVPEELIRSIRDVDKNLDITDSSMGELCVFMSAKGAAGSSMLASSLAHSVAAQSSQNKTLVLDLDLQYGSLPVYFDKTSTTKLTQTLLASETVDQTLLDACLIKTESNIDVLASHSDSVFSSWDVSQQGVSNLLNLVLSRYTHVIVDIPKQIDPISFQAIERAKKICIVMQQDLSDLRQARQIVTLLKDQGVSNDRIHLVVNRFDKKNIVRITDVEDAFDNITISSIPNDYKKMTYAVDNNIGVTNKWGSSPLSKAITNLRLSIWPDEPVIKKGFFGRSKRAVHVN